jgi:hypothetical protein
MESGFLQRREREEAVWKESAARERALKEYPGEYVAVRNGDIIEHSKEMDALFAALRERRSKGESMLNIFTDRLVASLKTKSEIKAYIDEMPKWILRDPTKIEMRELRRSANAQSIAKDMHKIFTV